MKSFCYNYESGDNFIPSKLEDSRILITFMSRSLGGNSGNYHSI
ncbi:hypothetical protein XBKB1_4210001 [Xenorhabdus bovienii str. kraussei Becker Underwood]|uniref:Uncharacterized protein n=1 Tax=Xenorhabdus bovienii str. kraussei Becker Underwood TaxID=1398204 RepID=A0A077PXC9_XENBV|nr:hypothetical protein XBKB1_4210001 [Xenorhabdus bovienii str. kraussei Becker Underwood]